MSDTEDFKCTASTAVSEQDDEASCCRDLYSVFLDPLSLQLKKDAFNLIHMLTATAVVDCDAAKEKWNNIILKIEAELGPEHIICEIITKLISERLRKLYLLDDAFDLVNERMARLKTEDFGSLLILVRLYNLSGDYRKSKMPLEKALQIGKKTDDIILQCLALAKFSCIQWHLQNPDDCKNKLDLCLSLLNDCDDAKKEMQLPLSETAYRLIDIYKTIGYNYRMHKDYTNSAEYYCKALNILEKNTEAVIQIAKLESQIGCDFSTCSQKLETKKYCLRAYQRMRELSENEDLMMHHPLTVIHSLAKVAHSLEMAERNEEVLELREYLYKIGEKYLTENHPETARLAADCAYLSNYLHNNAKEASYIEKAEAALEQCGNQMDVEYIKTHVRELSDAWHNLGKVYSNKECFEKSERCYIMAISVNTRVYGSNHPRLSRLHESLGFLYKRFDRFSEAYESFRKCKEITLEFNPQNEKVLQKVSKQMAIVSKLDKKKYTF